MDAIASELNFGCRDAATRSNNTLGIDGSRVKSTIDNGFLSILRVAGKAKGSRNNGFRFWGVEAHVWQGAERGA